MYINRLIIKIIKILSNPITIRLIHAIIIVNILNYIIIFVKLIYDTNAAVVDKMLSVILIHNGTN